MSESFEQMLEDSLKIIRNGETVEGTVISVKPDERSFLTSVISLTELLQSVNIPMMIALT